MGQINKMMTIRTQLTWVIFISILTVTVICAAIFLYVKSEDLNHQHKRDAVSMARVLSQDLMRVILLNDTDVTNDMVRKISAFTDITHAYVITTKGLPVLNYTRPGFEPIDFRGRIASTLKQTGNLQYVASQIKHSGKTYGEAYFYFRNLSFAMEFTNFLNRLWYIAPGLLILSFLISWIAQFYITRPIQELSKAVDVMQDGRRINLDESRAHSREMVTLFHGFRDMSEKISETKKMLAEQKEHLHVMLESIADGVIATNMNGVVNYLNPAAEHILQIQGHVAMNRNVNDIFRLETDNPNENISNIVDETIVTGKVHINLENASVTTSENEKVPVQSTVSPIRDQNGHIIGVIIVFQNVSQARELADQLYHQATHDPLTGIINRSEFELQLRRLIKNSGKKTNHALLYLDLDQFKLVNDTSGHSAGDALLVQIAFQLSNTLRDNDIIARLGGDEFAVLLEACDIEQAQGIANKILKNISELTFVWNDQAFRIGVSIGLVPIVDSFNTSDELLREADLACYAAKDSGRNRVHVYTVEDKSMEKRHSEMHWANLVRHAIDNDKLILFAQHVRAIDKDNKTNHFEILVRYMDDSNRIRLPGTFLPAVERYGLAPVLDRWVIKNVFENEYIVSQLKVNRNIRININLSGHTLNEPSLIDFIAEMLVMANLPPRTICFEITETAAVTNLGATAHFMRKMKLLGCEFALDDFGSGVSSFGYLKNLPIDYLKIDGAFVHDIDSNLINRAMVSAINDIGHVMKIKTVAEFVTNSTVCEVLQSMNVDYAQGFFVHEPCPLADIFKGIHDNCAKSVCEHAK